MGCEAYIIGVRCSLVAGLLTTGKLFALV